MTIFKHENFEIDLTEAHKAKLYQNNKLVFFGDGYRAITILLRNCKNSAPVEKKFKAQLNTRQKSEFKESE